MCKINGKKLKEIREREGLTLQDVAKGCGVSYSTISKYESEINNPSDATVDKICLLLKINKNDIEVADVGYSFTSGEGKLTEKIRKKKGFIRYSTPRNTEEFIQAHSNAGESMEMKEGYVGLVFARSGLSCKQGLAPANKVGVIDADYRSSIKVALYNQSKEVRTVSDGDRIAQIIIQPVTQFEFKEVDKLSETDRGEGGFGSTGKA